MPAEGGKISPCEKKRGGAWLKDWGYNSHCKYIALCKDNSFNILRIGNILLPLKTRGDNR